MQHRDRTTGHNWPNYDGLSQSTRATLRTMKTCENLTVNMDYWHPCYWPRTRGEENPWRRPLVWRVLYAGPGTGGNSASYTLQYHPGHEAGVPNWRNAVPSFLSSWMWKFELLRTWLQHSTSQDLRFICLFFLIADTTARFRTNLLVKYKICSQFWRLGTSLKAFGSFPLR